MAQLAQDRLRNLVSVRSLALPRLGEALDDLALPAVADRPVAVEGRQNPLVPKVLAPRLELLGRLAQRTVFRWTPRRLATSSTL